MHPEKGRMNEQLQPDRRQIDDNTDERNYNTPDSSFLAAETLIAIVRITFRFSRRIISFRSARTRKQKRLKENRVMAF